MYRKRQVPEPKATRTNVGPSRNTPSRFDRVPFPHRLRPVASDATITLALAFGVGGVVSAVASRVKIPAVLPLLVCGVALGPSLLGVVDASSLGGPSGALGALIALSIGLLVFEGGLHLDKRELGHAPRAVIALLTVGALVTWAGIAAAAILLLKLQWPIALVLGAVMIVTGPTVIQPIIRNVRLNKRLHSVLSAEAILIDPIGVLISVLTLEVVAVFYASAQSGSAGAVVSSAQEHLLRALVPPVVGGLIVGVACAAVGWVALRVLARGRGVRSHSNTLNIAAIGVCMLAIGAGEFVAPEGGLVAATIAAVILANARVIASSQVRAFKEQVASLLVGMLFILLASQIRIERVMTLGPEHAAFVAAVLLVVRPINASLSTIGSRLNTRERTYLALFAPRGIVAASVAALAASRLSTALEDVPGAHHLVEQARSLDLIVFAVIAASVTWATISAWPMGKVLGVLAGPPRGLMIVGAHRLGRDAARVLAESGVITLLIDSNPRNVDLAIRESLPVVRGDATDVDLMIELQREHDIGWVITWTTNDDIDAIVSRWADRTLGEGRARVGLPAPPTAEKPAAMSPSATLRHIEHALQEGRLELAFVPPEYPGARLIRFRGVTPLPPPRPGESHTHDERWLVLRAKESTMAQLAAPSGK